MKLLAALVNSLSRALALAGAVCLLLMMLQVAADIVTKYLFNAPIEGTLELVSQYYMVGIVFLSLAYVEHRREYIRADLLLRLMPPGLARATYFVACAVVLAFFGILLWTSFKEAMRSTAINEMMMGSSYILIWPSKWFLPVGFAVVCLAVLLRTLQAIVFRDRFDPVRDRLQDES